MRAVRLTPLFRIALLSLAVLFAHTARATNVRRIIPSAPPCPRKVAAAQPDPEKKLPPAGKRIVTRGHLADLHNLFGGSFSFAVAQATCFLSAHSTHQIALARWTLSIAPQRPPLVLRL